MVIFKGDNNEITRPQFKKTLLAISISVCAHSYVFAQGSSEELGSVNALEEEVVIVTGIRGNLQNAQNIKRNSDTFVDAISAKDIGSLPDVSVLEALQRLPGISIERFASPRDSDHFSTEGSGATLRGLPQTRTSFNGRDTFSATSNRGLSFEDVSPELLGSVGVFKNQTADMIEGGISGTIDLRTRKPFDSDERVIKLSAQANYHDLVEETTPTFSGLYSDRFEFSSGAELGWLLSYADSELEFRSDGAELGLHNEIMVNGSNVFAPINAGIRTNRTERNREGLTASLQFRDADDRFEGTLEYIRSESDIAWNEFAFFSDDAQGTLDDGAIISGNTVQSGRLSTIGDGLGPQTRRNATDELVQDLSLNLKFQATDRLSIEADFQYVDAESENLDLTVFGGLVRGVDAEFNANGGSPIVDFHAPENANQSDEEYFSDPNNYFWRAGLDHIDENEGDEVAIRFDVDYEINSGIFESVETGVRFAEREQTTRYANFNWQNLSESWNEGFRTFAGRQFENGDVDATGASTEAPTPDSMPVVFDNFFRGDAGGGLTALFPSTNLVQNYSDFIASLSSFPFNQGPLDLFARPGVIPGTPYLPAEINEVTEENTAVYVRLNFGGGDENRFSGNVGLRYVQVDTTVKGGLVFPNPIDEARLEPLTPEQRAFANGASNTEDAESDFSKVLPSFNVKYEIVDDLIARFGYSAAIAFPDLGDLRYNFNITADIETVGDDTVPDRLERFQQISGNPFLEPMEADNLDLSLEWYFAESGSLTGSFFYKDIENFFSIDTVNRQVSNNGVTQTVETSQPINIGQAKLRGFEFAYQQFFKGLPQVLDGLGVQFNYTYLSESGVPNQNTSATDLTSEEDINDITVRFEGLPLQGLSEHSYNLVGIYENHGVSARLAYNWRDDYLLSINHVNLNLPVFAEDRGQLDGSIFYDINETVAIGLQASNLTNEETNTLLQVDQEGTKVTRSSFVNDRRFSFIIRASL